MDGDLDDAGGGSGGLLRPTPLSNPPVDKLGGGVLKVFLYYTPRMTDHCQKLVSKCTILVWSITPVLAKGGVRAAGRSLKR